MCWKLLETVLNYPKCQQLAKKLALISETSPFCGIIHVEVVKRNLGKT